jgi:hypothetical protein
MLSRGRYAAGSGFKTPGSSGISRISRIVRRNDGCRAATQAGKLRDVEALASLHCPSTAAPSTRKRPSAAKGHKTTQAPHCHAWCIIMLLRIPNLGAGAFERGHTIERSAAGD